MRLLGGTERLASLSQAVVGSVGAEATEADVAVAGAAAAAGISSPRCALMQALVALARTRSSSSTIERDGHEQEALIWDGNSKVSYDKQTFFRA